MADEFILEYAGGARKRSILKLGAVADGKVLKNVGGTVVGVGMGEGSGLAAIAFRADGYFRIASAIDVIEPASGFTIDKIVLRREIAGTSGTSEVDILKNGVTIFTTAANRPKVTAAAGDQARTTAVPDVTAVAAEDRLEMDILGVEDGDPQDLVAIIIPLV